MIGRCSARCGGKGDRSWRAVTAIAVPAVWATFRKRPQRSGAGLVRQMAFFGACGGCEDSCLRTRGMQWSAVVYDLTVGGSLFVEHHSPRSSLQTRSCSYSATGTGSSAFGTSSPEGLLVRAAE